MDAKIKVEIFVSEDEIKENFGVERDYTLDDEKFQEKCDCTDMSPYDKDIAVLQRGNLRLELSTTCDRWNVYFVVHDGDATVEFSNATLESKKWGSIADIIDYLVDAVDF